MRFLIPFLLLVSCAPTVGPGSGPDGTLRAAFSDAGVAWAAGGRACVARQPSFTPVCPRLPGVVAVAWHAGQAWAGVPGLASLVTLDGAPATVPVGRVTAMSAERVYREDGSAVDYAGAAAPGVRGRAAEALTGGDGEEYLLLGGRVVRVRDAATLPGQGFSSLNWRPGGVSGGTFREVGTETGSYRLTGTHLERVDAAGQVRARVPHGAGAVGRVGAWIVTVDTAGRVRVFGPDLGEQT
ncbi:hypothetical protein LAJ19_09145 [Deinococcus taeanensis]|uniref:hypothetical protein n=1 Tax=Deinococcus taeanensis TaxID=2737050 RepID=UPI001CDCE642|nr:hypothetical protein [Deinococcus taeanensis]UBV41813.1 hypothetical protein LAJ19_09145 [Deinococcus taeanensis]